MDKTMKYLNILLALAIGVCIVIAMGKMQAVQQIPSQSPIQSPLIEYGENELSKIINNNNIIKLEIGDVVGDEAEDIIALKLNNQELSLSITDGTANATELIPIKFFGHPNDQDPMLSLISIGADKKLLPMVSICNGGTSQARFYNILIKKEGEWINSFENLYNGIEYAAYYQDDFKMLLDFKQENLKDIKISIERGIQKYKDDYIGELYDENGKLLKEHYAQINPFVKVEPIAYEKGRLMGTQIIRGMRTTDVLGILQSIIYYDSGNWKIESYNYYAIQ